MTATPAQVANDLDAQAAFFDRRESDLAADCRDCACAIRAMLNDCKIDGRTYNGVDQRMMNMEARYRGRPDTQIAKSISRGRSTLQQLHWQLTKAAQ